MKISKYLSLAFAAVALLFTACEDEVPPLTVPNLTITTADGGEVLATLDNVPAAGMEETTYKVTSNSSWTATSSDSWLAVNPAESKNDSGVNKTTDVFVSVLANTAASSRNATLTIEVSKTVKFVLTVTQLGEGQTPVGDAIYSENVGETVAKVNSNWPYVDAFTGWTKGGKLDQAAVTYTGKSASVRNSGTAYDPTEGSEVSGYPYVAMNASAVFNINKINITGNTNLIFKFSAQSTASTLSASPFTPTFADITTSSIALKAGFDGTNFADLTYTVAPDGNSWFWATSEFKVPAGKTELYIQFSNFTGGQTLRLDDFKMYAGGNGAEINPGTGGGGDENPFEKGTVGYAINAALGAQTVTGATVLGINARSLLIGDSTGKMLVYLGADLVTSVAGDVVTVEGTTSSYGGLVQFGAGSTVTKTGSATVEHATPETMDGAAMDAYLNNTTIKYVTYQGQLTIDKEKGYCNVAVEGATTAIGSISYPIDGFISADLDGKNITVTGYTIGASSSKYVNTMAISVVGAGGATLSVAPTALNWAADKTDAQTVTVTAKDASGAAVTDWTAALSAETDFTITTDKTAGTISVTPKAANESTTDDKTATLTISYSGIDKTVALTQKCVASATSIADVIKGSKYTMKGTVTALSSNGFILTDATGSIFCYKLPTGVTVAIGDVLTVDGTISAYGTALQIAGASATIIKDGTEAVVYPTPTVLDGTAIDAFIAVTADRLATYVSVTGEVLVDSSYYNLIVDGTSNQGSVYYATDAIKALLKKGDNVTLKGYAIAVSSGKFCNIVVTDVTVNSAAETISVDPTSLSWTADATDGKVVTVTASSTWTIAKEGLDWANVTEDHTANTITVKPNAANETTTANTGKITVTCGTATATISVRQNGVISGNVASLTNDEIKATFTGFSGTSGYVTQTITSTSGNWTGNMYSEKALEYLQLRAKTGSYILSPEFAKNIASIAVTTNSKTYVDRNIYIMPADFEVPTGSYTQANLAGSLAISAKTEGGKAEVLTLTPSSSVKQFKLLVYGGATYIDSIEITFAE